MNTNLSFNQRIHLEGPLTMQPFAMCHSRYAISHLPSAIRATILARTNSSAHNGPRAPFHSNNNNNNKRKKVIGV
jgi:hypothetical protein